MGAAHLDWKLVSKETGLVDLDAWKLRVLAKTGVGTCPPPCGGSLMPEPPERDRPNVTWLTAECSVCGRRLVQVAEHPIRSHVAA